MLGRGPIGQQYPVDYGLEFNRTEAGRIGFHFWRGGHVPVSLADNTLLQPINLGQCFDLTNGTTIRLPDFTKRPTYSSANQANRGQTVFFRLVAVGSATIAMEAGGTGGIVRRGAVYGSGSLESSVTITAAGASEAHHIHAAEWDGARWNFYRLTA